MSHLSKIALIMEMLEAAESSLRSAKQMMMDISGAPSGGGGRQTAKTPAFLEGDNTVVEGIFDGKYMIGTDEKEYAVPANYASKSKLIPGDQLKLTIPPDGSFIYKCIGPVERRRVRGPLLQEEGQYKVIAEGRAYKILLASVTFFRAEPGDEVVLIIPEVGDAEWAAVDNVVPKLMADIDAEEDFTESTGMHPEER